MHRSLLTLLSLALLAVSKPLVVAPKSDANGDVWAALANAPPSLTPRADVHARADTTWNPPAELVQGLKEVWDHEMSTYGGDPLTYKNYGFDQIMANKGYINYCVRWDSTATVTEAQRAQIETKLQGEFAKWMQYLIGFDGFPYSSVPVKVVGWAAKSASLLQGSTSGVDVYTSTMDVDGIPECDPRCSRSVHQDGNYASCPAGAARHYDMSLWLTDGLEGGFGGDWGQQIGREYFMALLGNTNNAHILLHEMGHTFALDDFYDWTPTGVTNFIMLAGSSMEITPFDYWMFRDWWRNLKSRYNLAATPAASSTARATTTARTTSVAATTTAHTATAAATTTAKPATTTRPVTTTRAVTTMPATTTAASGTVQKWGQCGGQGYTGPTSCVAGSTCTVSNQYYSQCL